MMKVIGTFAATNTPKNHIQEHITGQWVYQVKEENTEYNSGKHEHREHRHYDILRTHVQPRTSVL